jgi:hypothetical protein
MKRHHRWIVVAAVAAGALAPTSGAFAESWRGIADTYLAKARVWTSDGFNTAERNGYLNKSKQVSPLASATSAQGQSAGALSQNALSNTTTTASTTSSSGPSGLTRLMPKKLSNHIPKSLQ